MGREYSWDSSSWPRPSRVSPPTPSTSAPAPGCSVRSLLRIRMTVPSRCPLSRLVCVTTCSCTLHRRSQVQAVQHCAPLPLTEPQLGLCRPRCGNSWASLSSDMHVMQLLCLGRDRCPPATSSQG